MGRSRNVLVNIIFFSVLANQTDVKANASEGRSSIWFASWQHTGHIKPLCPIALELQLRGWDVRIAVHDEMLDVVPHGLHTAHVGGLPWNWSQELTFRDALWNPSSPQGDQADGQPNARAELSERYFVGSQRSLAEGLNVTLQQLPRSFWPGLLVVDVASVGVMDLAEQLQLPYAVVSSWPLGPTLQSIADPHRFANHWLPSELFIMLQSADQQGFADRLKRAVFTQMLPRFMETAGFHQPRRELRSGFGLSTNIELLEVPRWPPKFERPLVVSLSHWGLDRSRPLPPNMALVGPVENYTARSEAVVGQLPGNVSEWLTDVDGPAVFISFGTNARAPPSMLRTLLAGIARMEPQRVYFLWDIPQVELHSLEGQQTGSDVEDGSERYGPELEELPGNVFFAPRVSQLAVLASGRISAFVSHCGLNSVHEASHFGVPVVGIPFLGDQLITARLLQEAGAGIALSAPRLTVDAFADAVRRLVLNTGDDSIAVAAASAARRIGGLGRLAGGVRAAADALEAVAEHGAGHLQMIKDTHPESSKLWDIYLVSLLVITGALALIWVFCSAGQNESSSVESAAAGAARQPKAGSTVSGAAARKKKT